MGNILRITVLPHMEWNTWPDWMCICWNCSVVSPKFLIFPIQRHATLPEYCWDSHLRTSPCHNETAYETPQVHALFREQRFLCCRSLSPETDLGLRQSFPQNCNTHFLRWTRIYKYSFFRNKITSYSNSIWGCCAVVEADACSRLNVIDTSHNMLLFQCS